MAHRCCDATSTSTAIPSVLKSFSLSAQPTITSTSADGKEQSVFLRCVDTQGKVYLIPQKMVPKVNNRLIVDLISLRVPSRTRFLSEHCKLKSSHLPQTQFSVFKLVVTAGFFATFRRPPNLRRNKNSSLPHWQNLQRKRLRRPPMVRTSKMRRKSRPKVKRRNLFQEKEKNRRPRPRKWFLPQVQKPRRCCFH